MSGVRFYDGGLELRYVGDGTVHLEVGFAGGGVTGGSLGWIRRL